jgi:hypothetical protein
MNYYKIYNQLTTRAKVEEQDRLLLKNKGNYFESHHILPRCMQGTDSKDNIAILTAREHFLAHWLLCRIYPDNNKIAHAFWMMCNWKSNKQYRVVPNSRIYQESKEIIAKITSKRFKGCTVPDERKIKISNTLKGRKRPIEVGLKISASQKGREGTHKGWITVTNGIDEKRIKELSECPIDWYRGRKNSVKELISELKQNK